MPIKEKISAITHRKVKSVALPLVCPNPKCGVDLTESCAVQQAGYVYFTCDGNIDPTIGFDGNGSSEAQYENTIVTAYYCTNCNRKLA